MSFVTNALGFGGSAASSSGLGYTMLNAQATEENRLKDETRKFDELAGLAAQEAKTLGDAQKNRVDQTMRNPNPWITSGAGALGIPGASRTLGGPAFVLGT